MYTPAAVVEPVVTAKRILSRLPPLAAEGLAAADAAPLATEALAAADAAGLAAAELATGAALLGAAVSPPQAASSRTTAAMPGISRWVIGPKSFRRSGGRSF